MSSVWRDHRPEAGGQAPRLWLDGADPARVARFVLSAPTGALRAIVGLTPQDLRRRLDEAPPDEGGRVALIVPEQRAGPAETVIEDVIAALADTAARIWPFWHGRRETHASSEPSAAVSARWVRQAEARVRRGETPRPRGFAREVELAQLSLAIHRDGVCSMSRPKACRAR